MDKLKDIQTDKNGQMSSWIDEQKLNRCVEKYKDVQKDRMVLRLRARQKQIDRKTDKHSHSMV